MIRKDNKRKTLGSSSINIFWATVVKDFREQQHLTHGDIATALGVHVRTLQWLETDFYLCSIADFLLFCRVLQVKPLKIWPYLKTPIQPLDVTLFALPVRSHIVHGLSSELFRDLSYAASSRKIERKLGELLKQARSQSGFTMQQISDNLGLTDRSFVNKVENNQRSLKLSEFEFYCNALGISSYQTISQLLESFASSLDVSK